MISLSQILGYRLAPDEDNMLPLKLFEGAPTEGFLGFAVNRLHLR